MRKVDFECLWVEWWVVDLDDAGGGRVEMWGVSADGRPMLRSEQIVDLPQCRAQGFDFEPVSLYVN